MLHLADAPAAPAILAAPTRRVLCNSWPKAGTHLLLEISRLTLGDGAWYKDPDIKYPRGDAEFAALASERLRRHHGHSFAIKGHFGRTPAIEEFLRAHDFVHLFAVRDPREVLCSTWRWLRDLRPGWEISRHLAPLDAATQLEHIITGLPVLAPFDVDHAVRWDQPLPGRYAALTAWLDAPDCEVLTYEELSGMRGAPAQFAAIERVLRRLELPFDHTDVARVAGLVCNPASATFHTGPASDWEKVFTDRHRHLFVEHGGEALVERLGYAPTFPARPRPLRRADPAAASAVPSEIDPGADLRAFVDQLGRFFGTPAPLQVDFPGSGEVVISAFQAGAACALAEVVPPAGDFPRLPLADGAADTVFNLGSLAALDDFALSAWLPELRRVTRRHLWIALEPAPGRDRAWWENSFIEAGFRKHALAQCVTGYEELEDASGGVLLLFDVIPPRTLHARPLAALRAERDLHMDMLREPGIRSDAHLARYILAREHVRPGHVVLDAACGLGYGSAALATGTGAARVLGVDLGEHAVAYARDLYGAFLPNLDFAAQDATHLTQLADASVDVVVSFETLEHLPNPDALLREFARVLKPGGVFIGSVPNLWIDEQGRNPVPYHLHIYDHEQFQVQIARHFEWRLLYRQNAGGGWKRPQPRLLRALPDLAPSEADRRDAEWWIAVAQKAA